MAINNSINERADSFTVQSGDLTVTAGQGIIGDTSVATTSPTTYFKKSRSGAVLTSGDLTGTLKFSGHDGTQYTDSARITSTSSGSIASTRVAGDLKFYTHPDSAAADPTLRMTIASTGAVTIASPDSGTALTITGGGLTVTAGNITASNGNLSLSTANSTISVGGIVAFRYRSNESVFIGRTAGNASQSGVYCIGIGFEALVSLTSGNQNLGIGYKSGNLITNGTYNLFIGDTAGQYTTGGITGNVCLGVGAGYGNITHYNTIIGYSAGTNSGGYNVMIGASAGSSLTGDANHSNILILNAGVTGSNKIYIGTQGTGNGQQDAAYIAGIYNTAVGATAGVVLSDSAHKLGGLAGAANTIFVGGTKPSFTATPQCTDLTLTGVLNLPTTSATVGQIKINSAAWAHAFGTNNTFIGGAGNLTLTTANAQYNTAIGVSALSALVGTNSNEATQNTAGGFGSLNACTSGSYNSAWGYSSGIGFTTGNYNCLFGSGAGSALRTTDSSNILIGYGADAAAGTSNMLVIGLGTGTGSGQLNKAFIHGIRGITTAVNDAVAVLVDSAGQLGVTSSKRELKENIKDMGDTPVMSLRPVTFNYKVHEDKTRPNYGLIAEEVAEIFPHIVVSDKEGNPDTIKYHELPVILLNELQKQQRIIDDLVSRIKVLESSHA